MKSRVLVMDGVDIRDRRPWLLLHKFVAKLGYSSDVRFLQQGLFFVPVNRHDFSLSTRRPESGVWFHSTRLAGVVFGEVGTQLSGGRTAVGRPQAVLRP